LKGGGRKKIQRGKGQNVALPGETEREGEWKEQIKSKKQETINDRTREWKSWKTGERRPMLTVSKREAILAATEEKVPH